MTDSKGRATGQGYNFGGGAKQAAMAARLRRMRADPDYQRRVMGLPPAERACGASQSESED